MPSLRWMVRFSRSRTWPAFLLPRQSHREGGHEGPADGRRRQELLNLLGLAGENLGDQVVGHRTLVAGEAGEKLGPHGAGDGHRCQAQTRRPAIGRFHQLVQPGAGLIDALGRQQWPGFLSGEGQAVRTDLPQPALERRVDSPRSACCRTAFVMIPRPDPRKSIMDVNPICDHGLTPGSPGTSDDISGLLRQVDDRTWDVEPSHWSSGSSPPPVPHGKRHETR